MPQKFVVPSSLFSWSALFKSLHEDKIDVLLQRVAIFAMGDAAKVGGRGAGIVGGGMANIGAGVRESYIILCRREWWPWRWELQNVISGF